MNDLIDINVEQVISGATLLVAIFALLIARSNLNAILSEVKISAKNHRLEHLKVVLEIETQMNERKLELDKASKEVRQYDLRNDKSEEAEEILSDFYESAKENYLNSLDRLCFCIDKKYLEDKDWRVEYRNALLQAIQMFPEDFAEASPYKNIKKVNSLWQSS